MPPRSTPFPYTTLFRSGFAEHPLGPHFHAGGGADDAERAVGRREPADGVPVKVEEARRVQQVDLGVHPFGVCAAEADGVAALRSEEHTSELQSQFHLVCRRDPHPFPTRRSSDLASRNIRSVPTSTPAVALTTQSAPSAAASPPMASP